MEKYFKFFIFISAAIVLPLLTCFFFNSCTISWFLLNSILLAILALFVFFYIGQKTGIFIKYNNEDKFIPNCLEDSDNNNSVLQQQAMRYEKKREVPKECLRYFLFILFLILSILSWLTVKNYMYPSGSGYFNNAKSAYLEHLGFKFKDSVFIASTDNEQHTIWDNLDGEIKIVKKNGDSLAFGIKNIQEPLFLKTGEIYKLINVPKPLDTLDISQGFSLIKDGKNIFNLTITSDKERAKYQITMDSSVYTSSFKDKIKKGYHLIDILLKIKNLNLNDEHKEALKDVILLPNNYPNSKEKDFKLLFLPKDAAALASYSIIVKNDTVKFNEIKSIDSIFNIPKYSEFFIGKANKHSTGFIVDFNPADSANEIFILYKNSLKYALPDTSGSYFLTSSIDIARRENNSQGYLLDIFRKSENKNHINSIIRFKIAGADTLVKFKIDDMGVGVGEEKVAFVSLDSNFYIIAKESINELKWIFKIKDRRFSSEKQDINLPLKISVPRSLDLFHITCFLASFLVFFAIRIFCFRKIKFFPLEFAVFVFILACATVRFILLWRMGTFIPLDAGPVTLDKLTRSFDFYFFMFIILGTFLWFVFKLVFNLLEKLKSTLVLLIIFLVVQGILCFIGTRFAIIFFPILTWLIFDAYCLLKNEKIARVVIYIITAVVLCKDFGFLNIFIYFGFGYYGIYWFIWGKKNKISSIPFIIGVILSVIFISFPYVETKILTYLFSKTEYWSKLPKIKEQRHLKYRIEIQKPDASVEKMLRNSVKNALTDSIDISRDMERILEAARNQWFINIYMDRNENNSDFSLQPHFNKGSSYTTQTTDVVVTRYILAEHPKILLYFLLGCFLLVVIFSTSGIFYNKIYFPVFGSFLLLYCNAFLVFLSATNRTVFFGQDFPFISLTSKLAVAFPLSLCIFAVFWQIYCTNKIANNNNNEGKIDSGLLSLLFNKER